MTAVESISAKVDEPTLEEIEASLSPSKLLLRRKTQQLFKNIDKNEIALMSGRIGQPTQFSQKRKGTPPSRGGKPGRPAEFSVVEALADLEIEYAKDPREADYKHMFRCYTMLSALLRL